MKSIPMTELFGSDKESLRAELKAKGAVFSSKASSWEMDDAVHSWLMQKLGKSSSGSPTPLKLVEDTILDSLPKATPVVLPPVPLPKPESKPLEPERTLEGRKLEETKGILKLVPSRYAIISVEAHGPRSRRTRTKEKEETRSREGELDKVVTKSESTSTIYDPDGHDLAVALQGKLGGALRRIGTRVWDGIIVFPLSKEEEFDRVRASAVAEAKEFNARSSNWKVLVNATKLVAVISDEEQAAKRVTWEIQQLLAGMQEALDACDVKRIRELANEAKSKIPAIAPGVQQGTLMAVVGSVRGAANKMAELAKDKAKTMDEIRREVDSSEVAVARSTFLKLAVPPEFTTDEETPVAGSGSGSRFSDLGKMSFGGI